MNNKELDYIIVGQGICGTFLSYYLIKAGKKVMVADEQIPYTASKVASGVINPVTGRRIVTTWRIEELLPFAQEAYHSIGNELDADLMNTCSLYDFHQSMQMKEAFEKRQPEEPGYLHHTDANEWIQYFNFFLGAGKISPCLLIDIQTLLTKWRKKLDAQNALINEQFKPEDCRFFEDHVTYKNMRASKIIFCDGIQSANSPFFKNLPFAFNKGEAIIAAIPDLPRDNIYKQGISIVPWKDGLFWVGSSYEWNFKDDLPSALFRETITLKLKSWLKLPFEIAGHIASVRPANVERRPFVGLHPSHPLIGILNGMGTKGCSLAPFFAKQLADHLTMQLPIYPDADVRRFEKVLRRET